MEVGDILIGYVDGEFRLGTVSRVLKNQAFRVMCEGKELSGKWKFYVSVELALKQAAWMIARESLMQAHGSHQQYFDAAVALSDRVKALAFAALKFGESR